MNRMKPGHKMTDPSPDAPRLCQPSFYQKMLLDQCQSPDTTQEYLDYITLKWAFHVTPGGDVRRIRRAFDKLTQRHDSLRLNFMQGERGWKARILPHHPTGLIVEDLGEMSKEDMLEAVTERAMQPMPILSDTLFQMHLLKFGDMGDVALTRVHHAVMDGYSIILLIEELLKHLVNLPVLGKPVSHIDFVAHRTRALKLTEKAHKDYWNKELLPIAPPPDIGRHKKGLPRLASPSRMSKNVGLANFVPAEGIKRLAARGKGSGVTAYSYLFAAFGDVMCQDAGTDHILINAVIGRKDAVLANFIGAEMQMITIKYAPQPTMNIDEKAKYVSDKLAEGIAHLPTTAFHPDGAIETDFAKNNRARKQLLIHIPHSPGRMKSSPFARLFSSAISGKLSFGMIKIERLKLPRPTLTDFELSLKIDEGPDGLTASLASDEAGFDLNDLNLIRAKICALLDLDDLLPDTGKE